MHGDLETQINERIYMKKTILNLVFLIMIIPTVIISKIDTSIISASETIAQKQLIVMCFTANWCSPCQEMKRTTWNNPQLKKYIKDKGIEVHRIDVDKQRTLAQQYGATSIPCIVVLERISNTKAKEINRFIGVRSAKETQAFFESCRTRNSYSVIGEGVNIDGHATN